MKVFQNSGVMPAYRPRLLKLCGSVTSFAEQLNIFLHDRFGAMHILLPVHRREADAFFTNGNDAALQRAWAREKGMKADVPLDEVLLAQIEEHCTEVFYNLDPVRYDSAFVRRLPGSVKRKIAWRAAPSGRADFSAYDVMVCNFPSIIEGHRRAGLRAELLFPAHDPELDAYAARSDRPIDVAFIGTYSRHHSRRARLIEAMANLGDRYNVLLHLDAGSRLQRLADTPLGLFGPLRRYRRPASISEITQPPVFGRELYQALSSAKVIVNGAIDMAGRDRGNMRCWEAMGSGALLLTDTGDYPPGMISGETMAVYSSVEHAVAKLQGILDDTSEMQSITQRARNAISSMYGMQAQYTSFLNLLS
jgi:hypothetical protein